VRPSAYVCSAAAAGLILATIATSGHGGGRILPASMASVPGISSGSGNQVQFAHDFLAALHDPQNTCDMNAMLGWEQAEGGGVTNDAANNFLNTTQREPGSWSINSVGVQAYPSYAEGLAANLTAIRNGLYQPVLSALAAGNSAEDVAVAIENSPWGTRSVDANC